MQLDDKHRLIASAVFVVVEYLIFSLLFDARELVPPSLRTLGDLAPMPIIAGVAVLILRASVDDERAPRATEVAHGAARRPALSSKTALALFALHILAYGAFVALSFHMRSLDAAVPLSVSLVWGALAVITASLLAAFALARAGFLDVARRAATPVAVGVVVGVAAWAAGRGTGELWHPLARLTLVPVSTLVGIFSDDAFVDTAQFMVGVERFKIRIDPVCSGYEGMGLVAVLMGAYLWTFRRALRFPRALALLLVAIGGAFIANVVRITALIYVGALGSADVAVIGFHSKAGWLLFCVVALGTTWLARASFFRARDDDTRDDDTRSGADTRARDAHDHNPTARYVAPLLALVAGSLGTGLASDGAPDHLEIVAVVAALIALVWARATVREALSSHGTAADATDRFHPTFVGIGAGIVVFALWIGLWFLLDDGASADEAAHLARAVDAWPAALAALFIATRLVASVAVVPLVEELAFRGFLLRRIVAADFAAVRYAEVSALAVVVSSVAFGALHDHVLAGTLAGVVYAAVVWRTGRLRDAVVAHAVTNALIAVVVLAFGRWGLWS